MSSSEKIRILIADDDSIVRETLTSLLNDQDGLEVVTTAVDGAQVFDRLTAYRVDVALLDVDMPVMGGIEVARKMAEKWPDITIIMLTAFEYEESLGQAIDVGVRGFLTKDIPAPELAELIRQARAGKQVMAQRPIEILTESYSVLHHTQEEYADFIKAVHTLPERLRPTFRLLLKALANKNIAHQLHLSEATVRSYVSDILAHTGCSTRGELAITAVKAGVIE
ncbi:MAG: response regulator transcription factor [Actinomycetaceae bacterium]|nr:response regulator transcription factor [Actinomycetaceae bacterium]MDY5854576.1 response regulator transcription factor [Arcanobacterium sp.]